MPSFISFAVSILGVIPCILLKLNLVYYFFIFKILFIYSVYLLFVVNAFL
uniref:Uncharacterized protein n=1 Tax=Anguilla anguilla TaxID=7936 RepID=A0A0E9WAL2_ANGAN